MAIIDAKFSKDNKETFPVAIVAVGALLVGSIGWDKKVGEEITRGDGLGYFAYGGSTVIGVFPDELGVEWDEDLTAASLVSMEVLVKAAEKLGKVSSKQV